MIRILVLALCWPCFAIAQPVAIQSGEHADFSRLVILYKSVPDWTFGRVSGGYELRPAPGAGEYDLSKIFEFIARDRIREVEVRSEGALFLAVDCDCHADAFEVRAGLVLDIKDGKPTARARFETRLPEQTNEALIPVRRPETGAEESNEASTTNAMELLRAQTAPNELPLQFEPRAKDLAWPAILEPPLDSLPQTDPELAAQRTAALKELMIQVGKAASDGLLDPILPEAAIRTRPEEPPLRAAPPPPSISDAAVDGPKAAEGASNFRFETAIERSELNTEPDIGLTDDGDVCMTEDLFDIVSWGQPPDLGSAISTYRAKLVGEFDIADPASIAALAQHYVYLTFGAEAQALLRTFEKDIAVPGTELLLVMADIMDDGFSSQPSILYNQLNCPTPATLWAVLAKPALAGSDTIALDAVLGSFSALPPHLRRHLGPFLAGKFLRIGDTATATSIQNAVSAAPGDPDDGFKLIDAEIAMDEGKHEAGTDRLTELVKTDGPMAAEAVVRLIDSQIDAGKTVVPDLIQTAAALGFEARGTPIGADLERVRLRALGQAGAIAQVLREADQAVTTFGLSPETVQSLRQEAFARAVRDADDLTFLEASFSGNLNIGTNQTAANLRRDVAGRLISLGMTEKARAILSERSPVPTPEDRLLFAESFLFERRPELAIGYLAGLSDLAAKTLRARAFAQAQDYDRAALVFADLGDTENRARAIWRAQDWANMPESGSIAERAAAGKISEPMPEGANAENAKPTLALSEALLTRSQDSRKILSSLLAEVPTP